MGFARGVTVAVLVVLAGTTYLVGRPVIGDMLTLHFCSLRRRIATTSVAPDIDAIAYARAATAKIRVRLIPCGRI